MRLTPHPDSPCDAVTSLDVSVARSGAGGLTLTYVLTGDIAAVRLPPVGAVQRADELWRHTCFEAFLRPPEGDGYFELNFAPSRQWAAYRFSGYRAGMQTAGEIEAPKIEVVLSAERFEMTVSLALEVAAGWRLGLNAIIEEVGGRQSYWALAHPAGRADFHNVAGFAYELPPQERP